MCKTESNNKVLPLKDKSGGRSQLVIKNPQQQKLIKWDIDGCVINDRRIRCDYLVQVKIESKKPPPVKNIFVELKGSDVKHAANQISATIDAPEVKALGGQIERCCVVSSRVPLTSSELISIKREFIKKHSCILEIKNSILEITV